MAVVTAPVVASPRFPTARALAGTVLRSPTARVGLAIVAFHLCVALAAPLLAPADPTAMNPMLSFAPPSRANPFGTDQFGRDILSRVIWGGRVALTIALVSAALATFAGGAIGLALARLGGWADHLALEVVDAFLSLPSLLLLLVAVAMLGDGAWVLIAATTLLYMPGAIRVVRAAGLDVVPRDFVTAARARGDGAVPVIRRELWPNVLEVLLLEFAMRASWVVLLVSSVSFLGFGVSPPTPDWGLMIAENRSMMALSPWGTIFPTIAIGSLVVGLNLAADGIATAVGLDRARNGPA